MRLSTPWQRGRRVAFLAGPGLLALLLTPLGAQAQGLARFTGYTRMGAPQDMRQGGTIAFVADDPAERNKAIGGTVYYTVLERGQGEAGSWGTGIADFERRFRPGVDSNGDASVPLDRTAKYLYLYQTINDRGTTVPIQSTSVKLLVDVKNKGVTSWGYFSGVGFATVRAGAGAGPRAVGGILPVSATHSVADNPTRKIYRSPAPAVPAAQPFQLSVIPEKREALARRALGGVVSVVWEVLDPASDPDYVMLLAGADSTSPSFRALWTGQNALKKGERSTVFGFTSNDPPTLETAEIRGPLVPARDVRPVATEVADSSPVPAAKRFVEAEGEAATPRPETIAASGETSAPKDTPPPSPPPASPPPLLGNGFGSMAPAASGPGTSSGPSTFGGAAGSSLGLLGTPPLSPSGLAGGGSSAGQTATAAQNAAQNTTGQQNQVQLSPQQQSQQIQLFPFQQPAGTQNPAVNVSVNIQQQLQQFQGQTQGQQQQQQQGQQQRQRQQQAPPGPSDGGDPPPAAIVPEPAALVPALVGLPFLLLFACRRRPRPSVE